MPAERGSPARLGAAEVAMPQRALLRASEARAASTTLARTLYDNAYVGVEAIPKTRTPRIASRNAHCTEEAAKCKADDVKEAGDEKAGDRVSEVGVCSGQDYSSW